MRRDGGRRIEHRCRVWIAALELARSRRGTEHAQRERDDRQRVRDA
jgi:hypothetical protein